MLLPTAFSKFLAAGSGLELVILTGKLLLFYPEKGNSLSEVGLTSPPVLGTASSCRGSFLFVFLNHGMRYLAFSARCTESLSA